MDKYSRLSLIILFIGKVTIGHQIQENLRLTPMHALRVLLHNAQAPIPPGMIQQVFPSALLYLALLFAGMMVDSVFHF